MGFTQAIAAGFKKYAGFSGRARRSEFWFWTLFTIVGVIAAVIVDAILAIVLFYPIFAIGTILPSLAVSVRRLHDTDKSGWSILISLIPFIGSIILLIWYLGEGTPGENKYGPEPLG